MQAVLSAPAAAVAGTGAVRLRVRQSVSRSACKVAGGTGLPGGAVKRIVGLPQLPARVYLRGSLFRTHTYGRLRYRGGTFRRNSRVTLAIATPGDAWFSEPHRNTRAYAATPPSDIPLLDERNPDEPIRRGGPPTAACLVLAGTVAAAAAFAYGDLTPILGSDLAAKVAPTQALARATANALIAAVNAGIDALVDLILDAYDMCVIGAERGADALVGAYQQLFEALGLTVKEAAEESGRQAAAKATSMAAPSPAATTATSGMANTPLGSIMSSAASAIPRAMELIGEHLESVKAGNWCGILCAKPFQSIAALALTLFKIGDSWVLAAFEYICAVLYAMPAYAAILAVGTWIALSKALPKPKSRDAPQQGDGSLVPDDAVPLPPSPAVPPSLEEAPAAMTASESAPKKARVAAVAEPEALTLAEAQAAVTGTSLPASAVTSADDLRPLSEVEQDALLSRVKDAKKFDDTNEEMQRRTREAYNFSSSSASSTVSSKTVKTTTSSTSNLKPSYSSGSSFDSSPRLPAPAASYDPPTFQVDEAEVQRIYEELRARTKGTFESSSSSMYAQSPTPADEAIYGAMAGLKAADSTLDRVERAIAGSSPAAEQALDEAERAIEDLAVDENPPAVEGEPVEDLPYTEYDQVEDPAVYSNNSVGAADLTSSTTSTTYSETTTMTSTASMYSETMSSSTSKVTSSTASTTELLFGATVDSARTGPRKQTNDDLLFPQRLALALAKDVGRKIGGATVETAKNALGLKPPRSGGKSAIQEAVELGEVIIPAVPVLVEGTIRNLKIDVQEKGAREAVGETVSGAVSAVVEKEREVEESVKKTVGNATSEIVAIEKEVERKAQSIIFNVGEGTVIKRLSGKGSKVKQEEEAKDQEKEKEDSDKADETNKKA